jgi:hypothetical protein
VRGIALVPNVINQPKGARNVLCSERREVSLSDLFSSLNAASQNRPPSISLRRKPPRYKLRLASAWASSNSSTSFGGSADASCDWIVERTRYLFCFC